MDTFVRYCAGHIEYTVQEKRLPCKRCTACSGHDRCRWLGSSEQLSSNNAMLFLDKVMCILSDTLSPYCQTITIAMLTVVVYRLLSFFQPAIVAARQPVTT